MRLFYDKSYVFNDSEKVIDDCLEFITLFRNKKLELNIGSDFSVRINSCCDDIRDIVVNMLKLSDRIVSDSDISFENIKYGDISIIYDNSSNLEELVKSLEKERDSLINSISRREKLLANNNYVSKAPSNIVAAERENLAKEKEKLNDILEKLK